MNDKVDWQLAAFDETLELAQNYMEKRNGPIGQKHLVSMRERITSDFSPDKIGRWLGWAQCALFADGAVSLEELEELNARHKNGF